MHPSRPTVKTCRLKKPDSDLLESHRDYFIRRELGRDSLGQRGAREFSAACRARTGVGGEEEGRRGTGWRDRGKQGAGAGAGAGEQGEGGKGAVWKARLTGGFRRHLASLPRWPGTR